MKNYSVKRYHESDYAIWNAFIGKAKNATFLFHRDFMEYHRNRFEDFSLMIFDAEKLVAVFPANKVDENVYSHQGLTYGGLVYDENIKLASIVCIFEAVLSFFNVNGIKLLQLKTLPSIYHDKPSEELQYALFLAEAKVIRRDTLSVIDLSKHFTFSTIRKRGIQKGKNNDLTIQEDGDFDAFWNEVLIPNLKIRHDATPVHSIEEISLLKNIFPENIRQFNVFHNGKIVAGTTIFETENVAHCQYISKFEKEENLGSLDLLFEHLITNTFKSKRFFDFGISNEEHGKKLNAGLSYWKESFGAGTVVHDCYEVETSNYSKLHSYFTK